MWPDGLGINNERRVMSGWFCQQWMIAIWLGVASVSAVCRSAMHREVWERWVYGAVSAVLLVFAWYTLYSLGVFTNFQELAASLGL